MTGRVVYTIEKANVTKAVDGDTLNTDMGKVRLLGINAPERNAYGYDQAKDFLKLYEDKEVDLIRVNEDKDPYGRLLRYVFFEGKNINELLVKNGFAHTYYYEEDDFTSKLVRAEREARKKQEGIWTKSTNKCSKCIIVSAINEVDPGEYVELKNICFIACSLEGWTIKDEATHLKTLDFSLLAQQKRKIDYKGRVWNDDGDTLFLRDEKGLLVLFYRY